MDASSATENPGATGRFLTRHGEVIALDPGHRGSVRLPSVTGYASSSAATQGGDDDAVRRYLEEVGRRVDLAVRLLALAGTGVRGADVLVVGASDGAEAVLLSAAGARTVLGTDHGESFVDTEDDVREPARIAMARVAAEHADALGLGRAPVPATITYRVDDITASDLRPASVDVILSWQTLEHVPDIPAAMREMARLLRPGGTMVHEWNPFFSIDGGHSAGTLDMPWGHVRLDADDLERFLRTRRPDEADAALAFLHGAMNRATQADVRAATEAAGLRVDAFLPRTRTEDLLRLTPAILQQCRRTFPAVTVADLIGRIVRLSATRTS